MMVTQTTSSVESEDGEKCVALGIFWRWGKQSLMIDWGREKDDSRILAPIIEWVVLPQML